MNAEVLALYAEDRQERIAQPRVNTPDYVSMRARDARMNSERSWKMPPCGCKPR